MRCYSCTTPPYTTCPRTATQPHVPTALLLRAQHCTLSTLCICTFTLHIAPFPMITARTPHGDACPTLLCAPQCAKSATTLFCAECVALGHNPVLPSHCTALHYAGLNGAGLPTPAASLTRLCIALSTRCVLHFAQQLCALSIASAQLPWTLTRRTQVLRKSISSVHVSGPRLPLGCLAILSIVLSRPIWTLMVRSSVFMGSLHCQCAHAMRVCHSALIACRVSPGAWSNSMHILSNIPAAIGRMYWLCDCTAATLDNCPASLAHRLERASCPVPWALSQAALEACVLAKCPCHTRGCDTQSPYSCVSLYPQQVCSIHCPPSSHLPHDDVLATCACGMCTSHCTAGMFDVVSVTLLDGMQSYPQP